MWHPDCLPLADLTNTREARMTEQTINTGDASTDQMIVDEMKRSYEEAGMGVEVVKAAGGGLVVRIKTPEVKTLSTPDGQTFEMPKPGVFELGGTEGHELIAQVQAGDLTGIRKLLQTTRAQSDWDDRAFMLDLVGRQCPGDLLASACAREPRAVDLLLLSGVYNLGQAWANRGGGTADEITDEGAEKMATCVQNAQRDLQNAAELDRADPTALARLIEVTMLSEGLPREAGARFFKEALARVPTHMDAYWRMVLFTAQKWGGSDDEQLAVARAAQKAAKPGSDLAACLFRAHIEVWFYKQRFEGDEEAAKAYLEHGEVRGELNRAFDAWVSPSYQSRRASIPYLHYAACWYFVTGDRARLKRAMGPINHVQAQAPWWWFGEPAILFGQAIQQSM